MVHISENLSSFVFSGKFVNKNLIVFQLYLLRTFAYFVILSG